MNPQPPCRGCAFAPPELLPENESTWRLWTAAQTQWRAAGWGLIGLDYPAVEQLGQWLGIDLRVPSVLRGIQALESAYLDHLASRQRTND